MGESMATTKLKAPKKLNKVKKNLILGYCPKCDCMIAMNDRETLTIIVCVRCKYRGRISSLKDNLLEEDNDLEDDDFEEEESEVLTESKVPDKGSVSLDELDQNDYENIMDKFQNGS
jgi:DNA-directed RNA polymerase subunit M/transcription elongation factor TFIIS